MLPELVEEFIEDPVKQIMRVNDTDAIVRTADLVVLLQPPNVKWTLM